MHFPGEYSSTVIQVVFGAFHSHLKLNSMEGRDMRTLLIWLLTSLGHDMGRLENLPKRARQAVSPDPDQVCESKVS